MFFVKIDPVTGMLYVSAQVNSAVLISLWILLKFITFLYLHVLPLMSCEFHENIRSEN